MINDLYVLLSVVFALAGYVIGWAVIGGAIGYGITALVFAGIRIFSHR